MTEDNLKEIHKNGNIIGAHTVSHPVMSKLGFEQQFGEISDSIGFLNKIGIFDVKTYCHPYGEKHDFDANTLKVLQKQGVSYSFSFEERDLEQVDLLYNRQSLPRYDCNSFPYGAAFDFMT